MYLVTIIIKAISASVIFISARMIRFTKYKIQSSKYRKYMLRNHMSYSSSFSSIFSSIEIVPTGELRLDGGSDRLRGRLEIYSGTSRGWSPFCSIGFGMNEAAVACRQLGLNTSQPYVYGYAYFGSAPDYLSGQHYTANCVGDEDRIDCCDNLYLSYLSNDPDERLCRIDDVLSICCSIQPGNHLLTLPWRTLSISSQCKIVSLFIFKK